MLGPQARRWLVLGSLSLCFLLLLSRMELWEAGLRALFPDEASVLHPRASLLALVREHLLLVGISSALTVLVGLPLGVWVTRPSGRSFLPLASDFTSLAQTFPPVAILALAVPMLGFGLLPTVLALFFY